MAKRKITFENNEYYHIYNRGVDKRNIVMDLTDISRILESIAVFNTTESVGSIFENSFRGKKSLRTPIPKLVDVVAFNILDNHYHFVLIQLADGGISKFMQSFGGGYTKYFNEKYDRSGALFQGAFRAEHVNSEPYLNYIVAYVNGNHLVHQLGTPTSKWGCRSSLEQYICNTGKFENKYFKCVADTTRSRFKNGSDYLNEVAGLAKNVAKKRKGKEDKHSEVGVPSSML